MDILKSGQILKFWSEKKSTHTHFFRCVCVKFLDIKILTSRQQNFKSVHTFFFKVGGLFKIVYFVVFSSFFIFLQKYKNNFLRLILLVSQRKY